MNEQVVLKNVSEELLVHLLVDSLVEKTGAIVTAEPVKLSKEPIKEMVKISFLVDGFKMNQFQLIQDVVHQCGLALVNFDVYGVAKLKGSILFPNRSESVVLHLYVRKPNPVEYIETVLDLAGEQFIEGDTPEELQDHLNFLKGSKGIH